jgi:hypothetical protein
MKKHVVYILVYPDGSIGYTVFHQEKDWDTGKFIWRQGGASCGAWNTTIQRVKKEQKYDGVTIYKIVRLPKFPS